MLRGIWHQVSKLSHHCFGRFSHYNRKHSGTARKIYDANVVKSLLAKLNEVKKALSRDNNKSASNKLMDFKDQVLAQNGKKIAADAASLLITDTVFVLSTF